jgi:hypothetical protein
MNNKQGKNLCTTLKIFGFLIVLLIQLPSRTIAGYTHVDISKTCNMGFRDEIAGSNVYGWLGKELPEPVASYSITYQDGTTEDVPLHCGVEMTDWCPSYNTPKSRVVFKGILDKKEIGLNLFLWENPYPDKEIKSIAFKSKNTITVPILVAISLSDKKLELPEGNLKKDSKEVGEFMKKSASAHYTYMDISKVCNMGFRDEVEEDKKGGWLDQGEKDFRSMPVGEQECHGIKFKIIDPDKNKDKSCVVLKSTVRSYFPEKVLITPVSGKAKTICFLHTCGWGTGTAAAQDKDFRLMPVGEQECQGVKFKIIDPDRNKNKSCIALKSTNRPYFPEKVLITPIDKKAKTVCFLHTCGWEIESATQPVASYGITYQDGTTKKIPLRCGVELTDWSPGYDGNKSRTVFKTTYRGSAIGLSLFLWENPYPDKKIKSITFESKNTATLPILVSISFSDKIIKLPKRKILMPEKVLDPITSKLHKSHPRLTLTDEGLERLKKLIKENKQLKSLVEANNKKAIELIDKPTVKYTKSRLLGQSRACMNKIYCLGLAYRLTKDKKFAERAKKEMFAGASFPKWDRDSFLDAAEMSHALAIGYDWFYHYLGKKDRQKIKEAIIEKGLKKGMESYRTKNWWTHCNHNWNLVCNGGFGIAALAIADENPEISTEVLSYIFKFVPVALECYNPDGGWGEGPGYWNYATHYICYFLSALETALKEDIDFSQYSGFTETGMFRIYFRGPGGRTFNFADVSGKGYASPSAALFFLARRFDKPLYACYQRGRISKKSFHPLDIIWFSTEGEKPALKELPLDAYFRDVEVAFFRSSWEDKNAVYVGFKGGDNNTNHCHLDLGTFVLDADGVRWATDLGSDNYGLVGYFDVGDEGKRWNYYRLSNQGHNTLIINGENQEVETGNTKITKFKSSKDKVFAVCDLTSAYRKNAESVSRGVALLDRSRVVVQDEIELKKPSADILWGVITEADVKLKNNKATLTKDKKVMAVEILSPANAKFEVISTKQSPPQAVNKDTRKLAIRLKPGKKSVRIVTVFTPVGSNWPKKPKTEIVPLSGW